jgi:hypothetical protein
VPEFIAGDDTDEGEWLAIVINAILLGERIENSC